MSMSSRIVFHHIPKCGGMTIAAGLALSYFPLEALRYGRRFPGHLDARASTQAAQNLGIERYGYRRQLLQYQLARHKNRFVFGHYPFSEKAYEFYSDTWSFISLFRNPVDRWYSEYHWNRYKDHEYAKTDLDMEAYLESDQGKADTRSYVNYFAECKNPVAEPSTAELNQALVNIGKLDVVGTLENMPQFQNALKRRFGRRPCFFKRNKNPAGVNEYQRAEPQSAFHKKLMIMLQADIEIYNRVHHL